MISWANTVSGMLLTCDVMISVSHYRLECKPQSENSFM